jgi:O-antigen/teichoic acid export membrane protein
MLTKFINKSSSSFFKNVITLMTGTGIAQAIPIALSPILTRIYSPEEFGLFALYAGFAAILVVVATGRYELAIMLPEKERDAATLIKLSFALSILVSTMVLFSILLFGHEIAILLGNEEIYLWLYLLPISLLITGLYQNMNYWLNRKKDFKLLASNRVLQSSITGMGQLGAGALSFGGLGLLFGSLLGQGITLFTLVKKIWSRDSIHFKSFKLKSFKKIALRYRSFPAFDVPTSLLNVGATHAPNILFPIYFSPAYAGFYYLTQRVLQAPISLIATSVLDVFKEEASHQFRNTGQAKHIFIKTFKWLLLISVLPSVLLFLLIEDVFVLVFGKDWAMAGTYAKIMVPALSIRLIANPLSFMIYIAEKQVWNLVTMMALAMGVFLSFFLAKAPLEVIIGISLTYSMYYLIQLVLSARFARVI